MRKYFFHPWIGPDYSKGFDGLRTLIVGPHMICEVKCPFKDRCADSSAVWDMDTNCPVYAGLDPEVMCLSNASNIEVAAFVNDEGPYPAYSAFTYYMLRQQDYMSKNDKRMLWDYVAFTNFLQHLRPSDAPCDPALFDRDYEAFKASYNSIDPAPQVLYVWNPMVRDCLKRHSDDFKYIGKADMGYALSVYIFVPCINGVCGNALRRLRYKRGVKPMVHFDGWYNKLVTEHLGASFVGDEKTIKDKTRKLAYTLKCCVESGWLEADEESLYFKDSSNIKWTTVHKGYFAKIIKDEYGLQRGANKGLSAMLNDPNIDAYSNDIRHLKTGDRLLGKISRTFGVELESHKSV